MGAKLQIISKGERGDKLYIIKEGIVSCKIGLQEIRRLSNNEYFGQNAILIDVKRGADIIALQNTICYEISKEDLKDAKGFSCNVQRSGASIWITYQFTMAELNDKTKTLAEESGIKELEGKNLDDAKSTLTTAGFKCE